MTQRVIDALPMSSIEPISKPFHYISSFLANLISKLSKFIFRSFFANINQIRFKITCYLWLINYVHNRLESI